MKRLKAIKTSTPLRMMTNMDPRKVYAWLPKRMDSGVIVWFDYYWIEAYMASVEPRHMWLRTLLYTEREYFIKKLSDEISYK